VAQKVGFEELPPQKKVYRGDIYLPSSSIPIKDSAFAPFTELSKLSIQANPLVEESAAAVAKEDFPVSLTTQLFLLSVTDTLGHLFAMWRQAYLC
jgi:hypothetical protein